jgi:predicted O-linked N-acetylglucosamine transferase (SPINDLY family)
MNTIEITYKYFDNQSKRKTNNKNNTNTNTTMEDPTIFKKFTSDFYVRFKVRARHAERIAKKNIKYLKYENSKLKQVNRCVEFKLGESEKKIETVQKQLGYYQEQLCHTGRIISQRQVNDDWFLKNPSNLENTLYASMCMISRFQVFSE